MLWLPPCPAPVSIERKRGLERSPFARVRRPGPGRMQTLRPGLDGGLIGKRRMAAQQYIRQARARIHVVAGVSGITAQDLAAGIQRTGQRGGFGCAYPVIRRSRGAEILHPHFTVIGYEDLGGIQIAMHDIA